MEMGKSDDVEVMRRFLSLRMKLLDVLERRDRIGSSITLVEAKIETNLFWLNVDREKIAKNYASPELRNLRIGENVKPKLEDEFKSWNCISEIQKDNNEIPKLDTFNGECLKEKQNCEKIPQDSKMWWDEMDN